MSSPMPRGWTVFERLHAEQEIPWALAEGAYLRPAIFEQAASSLSVAVLGPSGSGKTALRLLMEQQNNHWLCVEWRPALPDQTLPPETLTAYLLRQALGACAAKVLPFLGQEIQRIDKAEEWVQVTLSDFLQTYLQAPRGLLLSRLTPAIGIEAKNQLERFLNQPLAYRVFDPSMPPSQTISYLAEAIQALGLSGVWLMTDGVEPWLDADAGRLKLALGGMLSSLALFEESGFIIKLFLPDSLEPEVVASSGLTRRRIELLHLKWDHTVLSEITEKRLALALGTESAALSEWFDTSVLNPLLIQYGGLQPRGWLEQIQRLAQVILDQTSPQPLSAAEIDQIFWQRPPRLRLDLVNRRVYLGDGEISGIQPTAFQVLAYLYQKRGAICSREELFYCGYEGRERPLTTGDTGYQYPKEYTGILDTIFWRLRQAIEHDPEHPIYLITERNKGMRLNHVV